VFVLPSDTPLINLTSGIRVQYGPSIESLMVLVSKVFLARVLGKRIPLRRTVVQKRTDKEYSWLGMLPQ